METPSLKTPRLVLRPLTIEDAPWIQEKFNDWEIIQYMNIAVPWPYPDDGALTFLKTIALPEMEQGRAIHWAITLKGSGEGIGIISFRLYEDKVNGNRGFWIARAHQRQGYITEAITAVNDYVFDVLGFDRFEAENAIDNVASRRAKEKTGARLIETKRKLFVCGEMDAEIWEVTKESWYASKR